MVRHKKVAVRDKYYTLAKEQGWRARSSFKLIQINRKYHLLDKASRVIDLCAAPGGWLQVCAKVMPLAPDRQIIGVDLLPIKPMRGVVTFQADITTHHCRQIIDKEMRNEKADVVLCDGAPNVGSEYSHDAFIQAELVLHALRFATNHLAKNGSFVSKVFRSADYNAVMWVLQQFFRKVEATKPESSRNVSAEIFVVCQGYLAPDKIDPRLLDTKFVFQQVENKTGEGKSLSLADLFHKKDKQVRHRDGYDDSLGLTQRVVVSAAKFIRSEDPVRILANSSEIAFDEKKIVAGTPEEIEFSSKLALMPETTDDIKNLCSDLKLLGKTDFRTLMRWRLAVGGFTKKTSHRKLTEEEVAKKKEDEANAKAATDAELGPEEKIDQEMDEVKLRILQKQKKEKRKALKIASKLQKRIDLNMANPYALDVSGQEGPFDPNSLGSAFDKDIEEKLRSGQGFVDEEEEEEEEEDYSKSEGNERDDEDDDNEDYQKMIEDQLNNQYEEYKSRQQKTEPMSVQQRRQMLHTEKKSKMKKRALEMLSEQDFQKAIEEAERDAYEKGLKMKKLKHGNEEEEDDDDDSDEEDEHGNRKSNVVLNAKRAPLDANTKASRWFSQPIFDGVELDEDDEENNGDDDNDDDDNDDDDDSLVDPESYALPSEGTDKAIRHQKRLKLLAKKARAEEKKSKATAKTARLFDEDASAVKQMKTSAIETVPRDILSDDDDDEDQNIDGTNKRKRYEEDDLDVVPSSLSRKEREEKKYAASVKAQELLSKTARKTYDAEDDKEFETVPRSSNTFSDSDSEDVDNSALPNNGEVYDSDEYDSDERAVHLATASLMVKKSTRRDLIDAAYNRYAFNDPEELPSWFVEDERQHNRPQLPVTQEMVDAIKARFKDLTDRPIKKVAEARARKRRQVEVKMQKIKKRAAAVVDAPDLTAKSKMRAIAKIYKGADPKRPNKLYAVATKAGGGRKMVGKRASGQDVKLVDKRLKKDKRNQKAKNKKAKKR